MTIRYSSPFITKHPGLLSRNRSFIVTKAFTWSCMNLRPRGLVDKLPIFLLPKEARGEQGYESKR